MAKNEDNNRLWDRGTSTKVLAALLDPDTNPFAHPKVGAMALADWGKGTGKSVAANARRALGASGSDTQLRRPGAPTAVILPGWLREWETVLPWGLALYSIGWNVRFVPALDRQIGSLPELGEQLLSFLADERIEDALVIAHSKGGLVAKQAMVDGDGQISRLIAVGTPFEGAPLANVLPSSAGGESLTPEGEDILNLQAHTKVNERIHAIEARLDQNVPNLNDLLGAEIIRTQVEGHTALIDSPEVIAWISVLAGRVTTAREE